jgi:hypothetical protein
MLLWMDKDSFPDQTGRSAEIGGAYMRLRSKFVWERFATVIKIDRIPLFDVH